MLLAADIKNPALVQNALLHAEGGVRRAVNRELVQVVDAVGHNEDGTPVFLAVERGGEDAGPDQRKHPTLHNTEERQGGRGKVARIGGNED